MQRIDYYIYTEHYQNPVLVHEHNTKQFDTLARSSLVGMELLARSSLVGTEVSSKGGSLLYYKGISKGGLCKVSLAGKSL